MDITAPSQPYGRQSARFVHLSSVIHSSATWNTAASCDKHTWQRQRPPSISACAPAARDWSTDSRLGGL